MRNAFHVVWKYRDEKKPHEATVFAKDAREAIERFAPSQSEQVIRVYQ